MARTTIIVEKWDFSIGWHFESSFTESQLDLALKRAKLMEGIGVPAQVYRSTPDGPEIIYESPRS